MKCLTNGRIILKDKVLEGKNIIFDNKIQSITSEIPENCEVIDAKGKYISPGLIDIHIHGNMGEDTMNGTDHAIETISKSVARHGVTGFLPTTMTMGKSDIYTSLETIRRAKAKKLNGSQVLGSHVEGPFINEAYKGAQNAKFIAVPEFKFIKDYSDVIKVITIAPEKDVNFEFIKSVKRSTDILISMGHSKATFDEANAAIDEGVGSVTHLFNAQTPLNHREPGIVGAALTRNIYTEIIADTIHVNKGLFQFVINNKGKNKLILITDSMEAGGLEDGEYSLGGQKVIVKDNAARLENGSLAGSVSAMNSMVRNFYNNTNLTVVEAINLASLNPATAINVSDKKGSIEIGKDADFALFDDDFNCSMTICTGDIVFEQN
ncbi:N-acetylglucosamine-6-phosphate deacetylase [Peptacetobacter sp.]|uniref:N-acetylglucosamine-6-phosphate deacetylase n=1 Tax=Peptacetobacter sp. TaxID=2991975 RepID=UPI002635409E|nr:N-acetylglucosamine-6-phosphate deacetylase [Peptacetobacter sp.]